MGKIPKLKESDRVKIIDNPDFLLVRPLTVAASKRYGHKSSWCTSTSNDEVFHNHIKKSILLYAIVYELTDDGKRGPEKTKFAVSKYKKARSLNQVYCYDRKDDSFSFELLKAFIKAEYYDAIVDYFKLQNAVYAKPRQALDFIEVGDIVRSDSSVKIGLSRSLYDAVALNAYKRELRKKRAMGAHVTFYSYQRNRFKIFSLSLSLPKNAIVEARVLAHKGNSLVVEPLLLADPFSSFSNLIAEYGITTVFRAGVRNDIQLIRKGVDHE